MPVEVGNSVFESRACKMAMVAATLSRRGIGFGKKLNKPVAIVRTPRALLFSRDVTIKRLLQRLRLSISVLICAAAIDAASTSVPKRRWRFTLFLLLFFL